MGHHHHHHHGHHCSSSKGGRAILTAFFLNAAFAIIEFIGGIYTNSMAIKSDAIHDFGDSLSLLLAYYMERLSLKNPDEKYTYGYRRFSVMAALFSGLVLLGGSLYVIYEAIQRIQSPEPMDAVGMLWLAFLGVGVNGYAAYRLHKDGEGLNSRMMTLHLMEDVLGWVAVLIVSVVLIFYPFYILDSILSLLIALLILKGVYHNFKKVGSILLQAFPQEIDRDQITEEILKFELVEDVHLLKGWAIDESIFTLSLHVQVRKLSTIEELDQLRLKIEPLLKRHHISYCSIQFEGENCKLNA